MTVIEKAKELGREIKETDEFKELERANESIKEDQIASKIIEDINDIQQKINFSQNSGVQPSPEQISQFNDLKEKMESNLTIQSFMKAQEQFNEIMQNINSAISEGIGGENVSD